MTLKWWCQLLLSQVHCSKLCFFYDDWRAFTFTPWLPQRRTYQLIYFIYRWFVAVYFSYWVSVSVTRHWDRGKGLLTYTHWCGILFVAYLVIAAMTMAVTFLKIHAYRNHDSYQIPFKKLQAHKSPKRHRNSSSSSDEEDYGSGQSEDEMTTCVEFRDDETTWYQKLQWLLFTVGSESTFAGVLLYWLHLAFEHQQGSHGWNKFDINMDVLNGVIALLDIWISGMPIRLFHAVYLLLFCTSYIGFTVLYYAANGTDHHGIHYIYKALDYERNPGLAAVVAVLVVFVYFPAIHILFYFCYLLRCCIEAFGFGEQHTTRKPRESGSDLIPLKSMATKADHCGVKE